MDNNHGQFYEFLAGVASILTMMGINFKWLQNMQKKIDKCGDRFTPKDQFQRFEDRYDHDQERLYDKLDELKELLINKKGNN